MRFPLVVAASFLALSCVVDLPAVNAQQGTSAPGLSSRVSNPQETRKPAPPAVIASYGKLPLSFEANEGQAGSQVEFLSHGYGRSLFLTGGNVTVLLQGAGPLVPSSTKGRMDRAPVFNNASQTTRFRFNLLGANAHPHAIALDKLTGKSNYLGGADPKKWIVDVPHFGKIRYQDAYPGVDLIYYGAQEQLESDFVVAPGADPKTIRVAVEGAETLELNAEGDLVVHASGAEIRLHAPSIYQDGGSGRRKIAGGYHLLGNDQFGFELSPYDRSLPLVIDPVLAYSTFVDGIGLEGAAAVAVDANGNAYVGGEFLSKFDPSGSTLIYSTYFNMGLIHAIALDSSGNVYATGSAGNGFPVTPGAFQSSGASGETFAFIAKLNPDGNALIYGTLLGPATQIGIFVETTYGNGIAFDASGNAYVTGSTLATNFPTTPGAYDRTCGTDGQCNPDNFGNPAQDAFVTKVNPTGTALVYSTYLGGSGDDLGYGIAVDALGNAYVAGATDSFDFSVTPGAFQTTPSAGVDTFVTKLNASGSALVYSTFLAGNSDDWGYAIAIDPATNAYIAGSTGSSDFPTTSGSFQPKLDASPLGGGPDAFVTKLNPAGNALVYSTYLGGTSADQANGLALDAALNVYVTGATNSTDFPLQTPFQASCLTENGECDFQTAFVAELNTAGSSVVYSSYLGGNYADDGVAIAVDKLGNTYVVGNTGSADFPVVNAYQSTQTLPSNINAFLTKISPANGDIVFLDPPLTAFATFNPQPVNTTSDPQSVEVRNMGNVALAVSNIAVTGDFSQTNNCLSGVPPAELCTVTVSFAPTAAGTRTGTLTVTDSAPGSPHSASLTGVSISAPLLRPSSYYMAFGNQVVGTTSRPQTETLTNAGTAVLNITSTYINSDEFQLTNSTCGSSLAVGASCALTITFTPSQTGTASAMLFFTDNDTFDSSTVSLVGNGFAAGTTAPTSLQFVPVTPCRVADTRNTTGPFAGPEPGAGSSREFDIPQSACNIPSTAVAYSLNVTVVPDASLNYLTLWPSGQEQPFVSTLNSDGRIKANAAIVPAGANGGVSIFVSDATQVILDIDGYFVPTGTTSALAFYPVTPCRVADTRNPAGPLGGPSMPGYTSRAFPILSSACNLPSTAQAYSLNVTTIPFGTLNYLTSWPTGETQPYVSTLNSSTGTVTANAAIVPAGSNGDISIFVSDPTVVILDVNGYFAPPGAGGLSLYTTTPCRVLDTRPNDFFGSAVVNVEASACAPPSAAQAYVLNATVVPVQGGGPLYYLTLWPYQTDQPNVSTLNAYDNAVTSNMAIVPATNGSIDAWADGYTNLILDLSSYFAP